MRRTRVFDGVAIAWLAACLVLAWFAAPSAPVTWDEHAHLLYGDAISSWFTTGGQDPTARAFRGDSLYGGGYDLLGAVLRRLVDAEPYLVLHRLGGAVAWLGAVATWRLARRLGPAAGVLALVLLTTTPVYVGHAFANPKDLPFAVGYIAGVLGVVQWHEAEKPTPGLVLRVGLLMGAACLVRAAGLMLPALLVASIVIRWSVRAEAQDWRAAADRWVPSLLVAIAIAWVLMIAPWPWALHNPIVRPMLAAANLVAFEAHDRMMPFAGEMMRTIEPRRDYAFHYLALKLPLTVLCGAGLSLAIRSEATWGTRWIVTAAVVLPLLAVLVLNPVLYDGMRHILFVVPPLCVLAAWGVVASLARWGRSWALWAAAGSLAFAWGMARQARAVWVMHPMQAVWFNAAGGGLPGAQGRYSLDDYGFTYGEAAARLSAYVAQDASLAGAAAIPVEAAMPMWAARWTFDGPFVPTRGPAMNEPSPMFYVAYTRGAADQKHPHAAVVATVEREGVVLAVVKDLRARGGGG